MTTTNLRRLTASIGISAIALSASLLVACGGGGGGGSPPAATGTISGSVSKGPVSGATVNMNINTANGKLLSGTGTTNTSGVATFTHKVNSKTYGKGTYSVSATASKTGYTSGTGSATFAVTR